MQGCCTVCALPCAMLCRAAMCSALSSCRACTSCVSKPPATALLVAAAISHFLHVVVTPAAARTAANALYTQLCKCSSYVT
jgi:anti-sigma factor RsiW